jgi:hypothetical protein
MALVHRTDRAGLSGTRLTGYGPKRGSPHR